jgi:hypothetical protein
VILQFVKGYPVIRSTHRPIAGLALARKNIYLDETAELAAERLEEFAAAEWSQKYRRLRRAGAATGHM